MTFSTGMSISGLQSQKTVSENSGVDYRQLAMEAEVDAWELLKRAWIRRGRMVLPVDPFTIAKELGIHVLRDDSLPPEVAGMLRKRRGYEDPEILLNAKDSRSRKRFTCAHALGHYNLRIREGNEGVWEYVDRREPLSDRHLSPEEVYADEYAAGLLMPLRAIRCLPGKSDPLGLAFDFGVSGDAMRFRLESLGLV